MDVKLEQYRIFYKVALSGSFTAGAAAPQAAG